MSTTIRIPVIFFLIFFLSKEIISYDEEKIVALCIISFILVAYYNIKDSMSESFKLRSEKLASEFEDLLSKQKQVTRHLITLWRIFLDLEDSLIATYVWIKSNIKKYLLNVNKNRKTFISHLIKDELNILISDQFAVERNLKLFLIKNNINWIKLFLKGKIANENQFYLSNLLHINYSTEVLKSLVINNNVINLLLNKLSLNILFTKESNNWKDYSTFLYLKTFLLKK